MSVLVELWHGRAVEMKGLLRESRAPNDEIRDVSDAKRLLLIRSLACSRWPRACMGRGLGTGDVDRGRGPTTTHRT